MSHPLQNVPCRCEKCGADVIPPYFHECKVEPPFLSVGVWVQWAEEHRRWRARVHEHIDIIERAAVRELRELRKWRLASVLAFLAGIISCAATIVVLLSR